MGLNHNCIANLEKKKYSLIYEFAKEIESNLKEER